MKKTMIYIALMFVSTFLFAQTVWTTDKFHTQLHFSATHFGIAQVDGIFKSFEVSMKSEKEDFTDAIIELTAEAKSIDTQVSYRDDDMRSPGWFDAAKYPTITFKSTAFKKSKKNNYKLHGNLTMKGVTKPIVLDVVFNGFAVTMSKKQTAGFRVSGNVKRSDFGIGGTPTETGVSDEIKIWANVEVGKN